MENLTQRVERETEIQVWIDLINKIVALDEYHINNIGTPDDLNNTNIDIVDSLNVSYAERLSNADKTGINHHGHTKRKERYKELDIVSRINNLRRFLEALSGRLEDLETDSKETIIFAINELKTLMGDSDEIENTLIDDINATSTKLYDNNMWKLKVEKDNTKNFTRAINNIIQRIGSNDLNNLQTNNRSNLIRAINEVHDEYKSLYELHKINTQTMGNVQKLKSVNKLVGSLNAAYSKLGQTTALYHSTKETKVFGVEAINHYIDKIGLVPTDLTTLSKSNLVSAITETNRWVNRGSWIYTKTNQNIAIGSTTAVGSLLNVQGNVKADTFKGDLTGNVTGRIIGNVRGSVSGTARSWERDISIHLRGKLSGKWSFGGGNYVNTNWKRFYKAYKYYQNSGNYVFTNKTIKDGYWYKFQTITTIDKQISHDVWEPSGYDKDSKVWVKRGYWADESTLIPSTTSMTHESRDSRYRVAGNGNIKLYESDENGNKLKYIGTASNTKSFIPSDAFYIRADIAWSEEEAKQRKVFFESRKLTVSQILPFAKTNGFSHMKDENSGINMAAQTSKNKKLHLEFPITGKPNKIEIYVNCNYNSYGNSSYAWWVEDRLGKKYKIKAAHFIKDSNGRSEIPREFQDSTGSPDEKINQTFIVDVPTGATKVIMKWLVNDAAHKKDTIQFNQLRISSIHDKGPAAMLLETSQGSQVPELYVIKDDPLKYKNRHYPSWQLSPNWIIGGYADMSLLYKTSNTITSNTGNKYTTTKKWVDTSTYVTKTEWIDTSKFVTKYKTIQGESSSFNKEWIARDRVTQVKTWKDTSKWTTRYKIDEDSLEKEKINNIARRYNVFVQNNEIRGKAHAYHTHDSRYLRTWQRTDAKYHYFGSCLGASSVWSSMNSIYNVGNYSTGSILISRTSCGGQYVWVKYKNGVSSAAWLRLK